MSSRTGFAQSLPAAVATMIVAILPMTAASPSIAQTNHEGGCAGDNGGIALPAGFCATVFADKLGHARHLVVAPNGVVYVNTWSGRYYHDDTPPPGGFLIALQDTEGKGKADKLVRLARATPRAMPAEPASRSITITSTPRPTIASCATPFRPTGSRRPEPRRPSYRGCR